MTDDVADELPAAVRAGLEDAFERALAWVPFVAHRRGLAEDVVLGVWGDLLALLSPLDYAPPAEGGTGEGATDAAVG